MLGILCIYSKKLSKRGTFGTVLHQNVIQHCGCLCCLTPQLLSLSHCESCMIHQCSCSPMTVTNALSTTPLCCGVPGAIYSKIIPNSFLSDSLSRTLFSPALSHLIIFTWILCLAFKAYIQSIIGSTCSFFFFRKQLFLYFVASSTNITQCCLPPILGFLIDEISNTSFLQDSQSYLHSSLGYSIVLFSPMSNLGNYLLCLSSQPCNILLWHPSNDVQHVLSLCGCILLIVFHSQSLQ